MTDYKIFYLLYFDAIGMAYSMLMKKVKPAVLDHHADHQ
jgi:hypothetical protein